MSQTAPEGAHSEAFTQPDKNDGNDGNDGPKLDEGAEPAASGPRPGGSGFAALAGFSAAARSGSSPP